MPNVSEEPHDDLATPPHERLRRGEKTSLTVEMLSLAMYGAASRASMHRGGRLTKLHFLRCIADVLVMASLVAAILWIV